MSIIEHWSHNVLTDLPAKSCAVLWGAEHHVINKAWWRRSSREVAIDLQ